MKIFIVMACLLVCHSLYAQPSIVSTNVLKQAIAASAELPATITEAHTKSKIIKAKLDSLEKMIMAAYPKLADKMKRRSARLNAMTGTSTEGEVLSLIPFNPKFSAYFRSEWQKMDDLEIMLKKDVQPFYGKETYKTQGYINAWDSVYRLRRPALTRYRDGILKLVQAEITYLEANEKMFQSSNEAERMQFVEEELSVLQKLVLLKDKLQKVIVEDGIEKVEYCKTNPQACGG